MPCEIHCISWPHPLPCNRTWLTDMLSRPLHFDSLRASNSMRRKQGLVAVVTLAARDSDLRLWRRGRWRRRLLSIITRGLIRHGNACDLSPRLHLNIVINFETSSVFGCASCRALEPAPLPVAFASAAAADGHQARAAASSVLSFVPHVRAVLVPGDRHR